MFSFGCQQSVLSAQVQIFTVSCTVRTVIDVTENSPQDSPIIFYIPKLRPLRNSFCSTEVQVYDIRTKGETELELCRGIWYGNLQFCPKLLSEGVYS